MWRDLLLDTRAPGSIYLHYPKKIMGDKSPKANQKKNSQNKSKNDSANQKKNQATAAKQAAKLAPPKKK